MQRAFLYAAVHLSAALTALPLAPVPSAVGATTSVRHTVVAATGDAAPAGGNYLTFSFITVRLNARHEVAFDALVGGPPFTSGVFTGDGRTTSTVALGTNPDPTAPSFGQVSDPFITPNGDVVFDVNAQETFRSDGRTIVPLVRDGDPAPGGGTVTPVGGPRAVNDLGAIAYAAFVNDSTATQGIFRGDGTHTVAIARDDVAPPTGGTFVFFDTPAINDRGQVAFFCEMTGGSADFGIFRGDGGDLTPVFVTDQIAPGGATFEDFASPVINRHGQVAAVALLKNSAIRSGLFLGDGTNAVAIALQGQPAPKGGTYSQFNAPTRLNDRGQVAFNARLTGGTSLAGIFLGDGEHTTTIALAGTSAPGTTGTFASFRDIKLLDDGRVAFVATLTVGAGGVDPSNNTGIWVGTSDGDLRLVVRTGEVIGGKVLTGLPQISRGNLFDINENDVLWVGNFGPAKAVVLSRIVGEDDHVAERNMR
jgi:hypothetical protein